MTIVDIRRLLISYYEVDARKKGLELLDNVVDEDKKRPFFLKMLSAFQIRIGEISGAAATLAEYISLVPEDLRSINNWLTLLVRLEEFEEITRFFNLGNSYPSGNSLDRMEHAHIMARYGDKEAAFEVAYDARRKGYQDPDVHLRYAGLILSHEKEEFLNEPEVVEQDTGAVYTNNNGVSTSVFIEPGNYDAGVDSAIALNSPYAKALIGASCNEEVEVEFNKYRKETVKVTELRSKFIHFFRETMDGFETMFPSHPGLMKVDLQSDSKGGLDPSPILDSVQERQGRVDELLEMYRTQPIPVGVLADWLGSHPLAVWKGLSADTENQIIACAGNIQERNKGVELIQNNDAGYVVDPLTLYHHYQAGNLELLAFLVGQLAVTQTSIDFYQWYIEDITPGIGTGQRSTLYAEGDGFALVDHSEEDIQAEADSIKALVAWIQDNCLILPAIDDESVKQEGKMVAEFMHSAFQDGILAAKHSGRDYISDDMRLRSMASEFYGVESVWSQLIFLEAKNKGKISQNRYFDVLKSYIYCGVYFTTFDATDLRSCILEAEDLNLLMRMLNLLGQPSSDIQSSFRVVTAFLRFVWNSRLPFDKKVSATTLSLSGLTRHYSHINADEVIRALVRQKNSIAGIDEKSFLYAISIWLQGHFVPINNLTAAQN